jgi:tetratricopeptide (TPR) repeat protein
VLTIKPAPSPTLDLARALGESGEDEYQALLHVLRAAVGMFAVLPLESDFTYPLRDALLEQLRGDLAAEGITLRVVRLSSEDWDVTAHLENTDATGPEVVALIGLEETPGIVPEAGAKPRRPPAVALLNHSREALRKRLPAPLIVWCDPLTYNAVQEHAPDFYDHYTALFTFLDAAPAPLPETFERGLQNTEEPHATLHTGIASPASIAFYEDQVARLTEPTPARARALLGLADALWQLHDIHLNQRLERALRLTREALDILSPANQAREWARAQNQFGILLGELPTGDRAANLQQAIACFQAALRVLTEADSPQQWAATQNNLGIVYSSLPSGDRAANLQQAIACFQAALRVRTEANFPQDWAMTQNNLGNAYRNLPSGDRTANLQQAIACYQAALRVRTETDFPQQWAMTQNNLGNAYGDLPSGDRAANLQQAIACYQAALRVRTEANFPQDWAMTQNNLGIVYSSLPSGDRTANLQQAIACYQAALRVRTEANFPQQWAETQFNMGLTYLDLLREEQDFTALDFAYECFVNARRGFEAVGIPDGAKRANKWVEQIEAYHSVIAATQQDADEDGAETGENA